MCKGKNAGQGALCCDVTVHVPSSCILHGNCKILLGQKTFLKAHNVRVDQDGMIQNLPLNVLCYLSLCAGEEAVSPLDEAGILACADTI